MSEYTLKGRPKCKTDRLAHFATPEEGPVLASAGEPGAPIATVLVVRIIDVGVVVYVMLTVLSEVEIALRVTVTNQLGAPVEMFVHRLELCVTFLRHQPTELVAVRVAPGNGARFTLSHEVEKIVACGSVWPKDGSPSSAAPAFRLASLEHADCVVRVILQGPFVGLYASVGSGVVIVPGVVLVFLRCLSAWRAARLRGHPLEDASSSITSPGIIIRV